MITMTGCENLWVQYYGRTSPILSDITLSVALGERVLILGSSGCGKSTLIQTLAGVIPRSTEAMTKGIVTRPERPGFLFQDPEAQFCMLTVDDEIAFSLENRDIPRDQMLPMIKHAKQKAGIGSLEGQKAISSLSGGMKQRLALAAVLACDPDVLFLDEPTAQIDPAGTEVLIDSLRQLDRNRTMIFVEHQLDQIIDWMDRVILLNPKGEVEADGDPLSVFRKYESKIEAYGIWKPRLWPLTWKKILSEETQQRVASWKPLKNPIENQKQPLWTMKGGAFTRKKQTIFSGVDATVYKGDWVAVLGPNGTGKSTLLKLIMGLLRLGEGTMTYHFTDGMQTAPLKTEALSKWIGFVFQNPEHQFVTDHVEDEVNMMAKVEGWTEAERIERTERLLKEFHLTPFRRSNPFSLSVGQKRRLSVASMILKHHDLLLLDEPTFGQDRAMTDELLNRFLRLNRQGVTLIMATHDVEMAYRYANRLFVLAEGGLLYSGEPYAFFSNSDLLKKAKCTEPLYMEYLRRVSMRKELVTRG